MGVIPGMRLRADTVSAIQLAIWMVNSARDLQTRAAEQLKALCAEVGLEDTEDASELQAVQAICPRVRQLLTSDEAEIVTHINAVLRENREPLQLIRRGKGDWHLQPPVHSRALDAKILVLTAMAMIDVIQNGALTRLGTCSAHGCNALTFDVSKNRSRKFCSTTCSNREAAAAHRSRRNAQ